MNDWVEPLTDAPSDVYSAMDRLAELKDEITNLDAQLKRLKQERAECQGIVTAHLDANNMQSMNKSGFSFHKIRNLTYCSASGDTSEIVEAVLGNLPKYKHLLNVNNKKMTAYLKEYMTDDAGQWTLEQKLVPKDLQSVIKVGERIALGQKKSAKK